MVARARLLQTWSSTDTFVGGLGGGYFALHDGTNIDLYSISNPATAVDTSVASLFRAQFNQNQAGDCYYIWHDTGAGTVETVRVTQSGGALTLTAVGGFSGSLAGNTRRPFVAPDASQLAWHDKGPNIARIISTADGSNSASYDLDTGSHSCEVVAALGSDLVLVDCATHDKFELFDVGAGSLLSDLARPTSWTRTDPYPYTVVGAGLISVVAPKSGTSPTEYYVGTLTTASSTVAWSVGPDLITPGWGVTGNFAQTAAWGDVTVAVPTTTGDASSANYSMMTVDGTNARAFSTTNSLLYPGVSARQIGWADAAHFVAGLTYPNTSGTQQTWSLWSVGTTAPRLLRQRQSPKRTPSRVRGVDLRQRQTPFI